MRGTREFPTNASPSLPNRVYAIRLAPVMVDMNLPLRETPSRSSPSLFLALVISLAVSPRLSFSRPVAPVLPPKFLSVRLPVHPALPSLPFPLRKFAMLHREEQKSISRGENWVTETSSAR